MIKAYVYKSITSHTLNHSIGFCVLLIFIYLIAKHPGSLGIKNQYDILHSATDLMMFLCYFLMLMLIVLQATKSYLFYIPSTYIGFDLNGISLRRFNKIYFSISWNEVEKIGLDIQGEWLLSLAIKDTSGKVINVRLSELWFLSISKKWCVNYNFLKLAALANKNPELVKKLDAAEFEDLYFKILGK